MTNPQADSLTPNTYRSYLVRFWQSSAAGGWRASAQCVQTGNTVLFGEIEQLLTFLQTEVNPPSPAMSVTPPAAPHWGLSLEASPLPTAVANDGPISPLANSTTTASPAATPLAGTALGSPGVMAALVIVGLVVVGSLIWQYRRPRTKP